MASALLIPKDVAENCRYANHLKSAGFEGGRKKGISRSHQLSRAKRISPRDAMEMRAWFSRHVKTSYPNYVEWLDAIDDDRSVRSAWKGAVAWLLWGGTAAYYWILSDEVQQQIVDWGRSRGKRLKQRVKRFDRLEA